MSKVPTEKLVRRADVNSSGQSFTFKGRGYEFDPLIKVVSKDTKISMNFDLTGFDDPEGEYIIVPANENNITTSFEGKKGIVKGRSVLAVIEVVDNVKKADLNAIRSKYLN